MKLNEFNDVQYYVDEISKAGSPNSKLLAKLKVRGEDGETKWLHINADSIKALNNWFNKKGNKKMIKENNKYFSVEVHLNNAAIDTKSIIKQINSILGWDAYDELQRYSWIRLRFTKSDYEKIKHLFDKIDDEFKEIEFLNENNKDNKMNNKKVIKEKYPDGEEYRERDFFDFLEQDAGMRHNALEYMLEYFDAEHLLDSMVRAMSDDDALDTLGYIARMNDVPKPDEEEDDDNPEEDDETDWDDISNRAKSALNKANQSLTENTITMDEFYTNMLK